MDIIPSGAHHIRKPALLHAQAKNINISVDLQVYIIQIMRSYERHTAKRGQRALRQNA